MHRRRPGVPVASVLLVLLCVALAGPAMAATQPPDHRQVVTYGPLRFLAPADWPVYDLSLDPTRCVRLDRNAVYLGHQGDEPACPAGKVGRRESIHVEPLDDRTAGRVRLAPASIALAGTTARVAEQTEAGGTTVVSFDRLGLLATLGYGSDRTDTDRILQSMEAVPGAPPLPPSSSPHGLSPAPPRSVTSAATAGVYTGEGFDACTAPTETTMTAWLKSPYRSIGIYIGGIMRACSQVNLTATWVSDVMGMGWSLVPIYVGLQAPCVNQPGLSHIDPKKADQQGVEAADDAVAQAQLISIGSGNPVYFDMESYNSSDLACVDTVRTFISAWSRELHAKGYLAGMYGGAASGIKDEAAIYGDPKYVQLDDIWFAHWNGVHGVFGDSYFSDSVWPDHQRLHQYAGGHNETYGGVTINIDGDYDDGAVVRLASGVGDFDADGYADVALGAPYDSVGGDATAGVVNVLYGSAGGLTAAGDQLWTQDSTGVPNGAEPGDRFGFDLAAGDFNADGYADLAVGVPGEDTTVTDAGAVNVIYGSLTGLKGTGGPGAQYWHQDTDGIKGRDEAGDQFGYALTVGDFDGDGYPDLAVGAPFEDVNEDVDAGGVNVLYGSVNGLTNVGDTAWNQDSEGVPSGAEGGDRFGFALASGDFDADGHDDLAVGVPKEDTGVVDAGAVNILPGSASGVTGTGATYWHQNSTDLLDDDEEGDQFGRALASGDFSGDGTADLAIGVPYEDVGTDADAGAVNALYGSPAGLSAAGNQLWTQDSDGVPSGAEPGDQFGFALAGADVNGDGADDLAVGVPREDITLTDVGAINVLFGSAAGLTGTDAQYWHQNSDGILDQNEAGDQFGRALAGGDFGNGAEADVVVAVPYEDVNGLADAGAANALYGSATGLTNVGDQFWNQASDGIKGTAEAGDKMGFGTS